MASVADAASLALVLEGIASLQKSATAAENNHDALKKQMDENHKNLTKTLDDVQRTNTMLTNRIDKLDQETNVKLKKLE